MKKTLLTVALLVLAFIAGYMLKPSKNYIVQDSYFDGEGNQIPNEIVQLLVTSQFVVISQEEKEELQNYFYFNNQTARK